jgi:hypothetical protein
MPVPPTQTLDPVTEGDTWPGIPTIGPVTINQSPMPWTAESATLIFRRIGNGCGTRELAAPVEIVDGVTWEFTVPEIAYSSFDIREGRWEGDFKVAGEGKKLTIVRFIIPIGRTV